MAKYYNIYDKNGYLLVTQSNEYKLGRVHFQKNDRVLGDEIPRVQVHLAKSGEWRTQGQASFYI